MSEANLDQLNAAQVRDTLGFLCVLCYTASINKGFWRDFEQLRAIVQSTAMRELPPNDVQRLLKALDGMMVGQKIALAHSELSEMLEGNRKGLPSDHLPGFTAEEEEMADLFIRGFDLSAKMQLRLADAVLAKLAFNAGRPYMHGKGY